MFNSVKEKFKKNILDKKKMNKVEDSFIIFSEPRGGSTWILEMLSFLLDASINWEPLHKKKGVTSFEHYVGGIPFIQENNTNPDYYQLFKNIHSYSIHNKWTRQLLNLFKLIRSKKVITKYVRANLLVPYLLQNFNFKYPPIYLMRHPIDTCISQIKAFEMTHKNFPKKIEIPGEFYGKNGLKKEDDLIELNSSLEFQVAKWCVNNYLVLNRLKELRLHPVFYSDILLNPEKELEKIINLYALPKAKTKIKQITFSKPSNSDFHDQFIANPKEQLHKNFNTLDKDTKNRIQQILDYFGVKLYDAYSPLPKKW